MAFTIRKMNTLKLQMAATVLADLPPDWVELSKKNSVKRRTRTLIAGPATANWVQIANKR